MQKILIVEDDADIAAIERDYLELNGYQVETAPDGSVKTTKPDPDSHGFGLAQMRAVVEKYESILDVSWTDALFTVQTALKQPEKK